MKRSANPAPSARHRGSESLEREKREAIKTAIDYMLKAAVLMDAVPHEHPSEAAEQILMSDRAYNAARRDIRRAWEGVRKAVTDPDAFQTVLDIEAFWAEREIAATAIGWRLGLYGTAGARAGKAAKGR